MSGSDDELIAAVAAGDRDAFAASIGGGGRTSIGSRCT